MRVKSTVILYIAALLVIFFTLFPFIWMLLTSFKTPVEIQKLPITFFPASFKNLDNYKKVLTQQPFMRFILNSIIVSSVSCLVSILITTMAGYGFSKFKFRGKEILFFLILTYLVVPFQAVVVPLYQWATKFQLVDTYVGLTLPLLVSAFGVFLMRQGMDVVPKELLEAARVDGSPELYTFFVIVMPIVKPFIATQAIIKFMWSWNEFFWPLVITNKVNMKVVTVGLQSFTNMYFIEYHLITAASIMSVIPMAVMFMFFQKGIVRGVAMSGLKA